MKIANILNRILIGSLLLTACNNEEIVGPDGPGDSGGKLVEATLILKDGSPGGTG